MSKTKSTKKVEEPKKVDEKTEVKTNETPKQEGEFKLKKPKQ